MIKILISFTSNTVYGEYMARIDMNENIVMQKFEHKNFATKINENYGICLH